MDAYMVYDRRIKAMNMHGGQVLRMPEECRSNTRVRVATIFSRHLTIDVGGGSDARSPNGYTWGWSVKSRHSSLGFPDFLDQENMEGFDEKEPQVLIAFLIAALTPAVLKSTVQTELKLQVNDRYRNNLPAFVASIKPQLISLVRFVTILAEERWRGSTRIT
uniref:AlNc14C81G5310 protein n=1 Tax=Albugo laibachii Nc14 TaxID=890382 RepID=F0WFC0_9STRA|nr:AlNc14C81G5310 [Albugo laibachii Nc14]|eukprot:CCA19902.1 AlNc14C81G5310 [Albugo laibachii Nc14]